MVEVVICVVGAETCGRLGVKRTVDVSALARMHAYGEDILLYGCPYRRAVSLVVRESGNNLFLLSLHGRFLPFCSFAM